MGEAELYVDPLDGVGVVRGPDLGSEAEHPEVEPVAAGAARLEEDVRPGLEDAPQQVVEAEDPPVRDLAGREPRGADVGEVPVHVPLDVSDRGAVEHRADAFDEMVAHVVAAQVEDELVPAAARLPSGHADDPVRVGTEQVGVRVDHLRLEPQPEHHPEAGDVLGQRPQSVRERGRIDDPVAESAPVVGAGAAPGPEPSVIHDEQFAAEPGRAAGHRAQGALVDVEEHRLPRVELDRALPVGPFAAHDMAGDEGVELVADAAESVPGERHHRLRGLEPLTGFEAPFEAGRVDPGQHPEQAVRGDDAGEVTPQ